jgi:hypothetical protein
MQQKQNWPAMTLAAVLGSGSGMGGTVLYLDNMSADELQRIARPDPATGTELRSLERRLDSIESRVSVLEALRGHRASP